MLRGELLPEQTMEPVSDRPDPAAPAIIVHAETSRVAVARVVRLHFGAVHGSDFLLHSNGLKNVAPRLDDNVENAGDVLVPDGVELH